MSFYTNSHAHQCFWYPYNELFGPSNVNWCEQVICSVISQPVNTYSNLSYLFFSILMATVVLKKRDKHLNVLPILLFFVGLASAFSHLTVNYLGQLLEYYFIFLIFIWPTSLNLKTLGKLQEKNTKFFLAITSALYIGSIHLLYKNFIPFQPILAVIGFYFLYTEYKLSKTDFKRSNYTYLILGFILMWVGVLFAYLDATKTICNPLSKIFQAHALWHILASAGLASLIAHLSYDLPNYVARYSAEDDEDEDEEEDEEEDEYEEIEEVYEEYEEEIEEDGPSESDDLNNVTYISEVIDEELDDIEEESETDNDEKSKDEEDTETEINSEDDSNESEDEEDSENDMNIIENLIDNNHAESETDINEPIHAATSLRDRIKHHLESDNETNSESSADKVETVDENQLDMFTDPEKKDK